MGVRFGLGMSEVEFYAGNLMIGCLGSFYLVGGRVEAELESCHW